MFRGTIQRDEVGRPRFIYPGGVKLFFRKGHLWQDGSCWSAVEERERECGVWWWPGSTTTRAVGVLALIDKEVHREV